MLLSQWTYYNLGTHNQVSPLHSNRRRQSKANAHVIHSSTTAGLLNTFSDVSLSSSNSRVYSAQVQPYACQKYTAIKTRRFIREKSECLTQIPQIKY